VRTYIGFEPRQPASFDVAAKTARRYGCDVIPLREDRLRLAGMLTRPVDTRGEMWDLHSSAPQSTSFAIARFFVPLLAHSGWCLFADSDVVFLEDPAQALAAYMDDTKAVAVVKHAPFGLRGTKMDGREQTSYPRKLWSSVMLWNVDHPANARLNLMTLNQWPGRDLHAFKWLADSEIGALPPEANWLVGMQNKPAAPIIAHFTLGTPELPAYRNCEHAELWTREVAPS
jgi:hypothetical protein